MAWLPRAAFFAEAIGRLGAYQLDEQTVENWISKGKEVPSRKVSNRIQCDGDCLGGWVSRVNSSMIALSREDYVKCFKFAIEAYYGHITRADFNRAKQRDLGEFMTNQIQGKLGELAVQSLLKSHGLDTEMDFDATGQLPSQDIARISTRRNVWNNPAIKVSIKATKIRNVLLAVTENELRLEDRRSDVYVLSQVGLWADHMLRFMKECRAESLSVVDQLIPSFVPMVARIAGWVTMAEVQATPLMDPDEISREFGIRMAGRNHVLRSGQLNTNWDGLKEVIVRGF